MSIYDFVDKSIVVENEITANYTSFKTGGPCKYLVNVRNEADIIGSIMYCRQSGSDFFVMGCASNLLISDEGFDGVIIRLADNISDCRVIDETESYVTIRAYAGCRLSRLAVFAAKLSCTGMEALSGIPGNVGGAVRMNAGAYDGQIADCLISSTYVDIQSLEIQKKSFEEHKFGYRYSTYQTDNNIVLFADFKVNKIDNSQIVFDKMKELNKRRAQKQPLDYPSAGSTFKRPEGYYAGALIQECNLKGFSIGGACVSEKHAGFVINKNNASSSDIYNLIKYIQKTVLEQKKILLDREIELVGRFF